MLAATVLLSSVQSAPYTLLRLLRHPESLNAQRFGSETRTRLERQLPHECARHIVFVRSDRGRRAPAAWYYNGPAPEQSSVIWAQEIDPLTDRQFLDAYTGRQVWVLHGDAIPPRLEPYQPGGDRCGSL
jgi:hypothetical protein